MKLMFCVDEIYIMETLVSVSSGRARCGIKREKEGENEKRKKRWEDFHNNEVPL
jgi:hypothetical protein